MILHIRGDKSVFTSIGMFVQANERKQAALEYVADADNARLDDTVEFIINIVL
jgi:hypothetical protein